MRTVAAVVESALRTLAGKGVAVTGAGRTDRGVHATGQVISFSLPREWEARRLRLALAANLPRDVAVRDVTEVGAEFSARRGALSRTYVYAIESGERSPLVASFAWCVARPLDLGAMQAAASSLLGERDFRSFCALPERGGTVREVTALSLERIGDLVRLSITAPGFLRHMVRTIVGTLVECGSGRRDPNTIASVLAARDRRAAGANAPPQGLYLAGVRYDGYDSYREPPVTHRFEQR